MTQEEIIEGNKLIAEFMGGKVHKHNDWTFYFIGIELPKNVIVEKTGAAVYQDKLQYHASWDWLMPVVEKIEKQFAGKHEIVIYSCSCSISRWNSDNKKWDSHIYETGSKIEAIYKAVVQFIRWHNTQVTNP